jgi:hypothetical protein
MMLELLVLHWWLKKKGLTTYEYIIEQREKKDGGELDADVR